MLSGAGDTPLCTEVSTQYWQRPAPPPLIIPTSSSTQVVFTHSGGYNSIIQGVSVSSGLRGLFTLLKFHVYKGFHHMSCKMVGFYKTWTSIEYTSQCACNIEILFIEYSIPQLIHDGMRVNWVLYKCQMSGCEVRWGFQRGLFVISIPFSDHQLTSAPDIGSHG